MLRIHFPVATTQKIPKFVDVTGLKHVIRAELLSCDKVLRYLRIPENTTVKNAAKDLRHLQEQAQVYRLLLLYWVTRICPYPFPDLSLALFIAR